MSLSLFKFIRVIIAAFTFSVCMAANGTLTCEDLFSQNETEHPLMESGSQTNEPQKFGYPKTWSYFHLGGGDLHFPLAGVGGSRSTVYRAINPESGRRVILKRYYESAHLENDFLLMNLFYQLSKNYDIGFSIPKISKSSLDSLTVESSDVSGTDLRFFPTTHNEVKYNKNTLYKLHNENIRKLYSVLKSLNLESNLRLSYSGHFKNWYGLKEKILMLKGEITLITAQGTQTVIVNIRDDNVIVNLQVSDPNVAINDTKKFTLTLIDPE